MAVRQNRFYNDPNIGAAFSNLASAFAPPDSGDIANYATAAATREKAARLAELFNYAKDPNYSQTQADRLGVLGGLYAPTQSYYAQDQNTSTTRRGQDVAATTSITNNTADNVRALEERRLQELGLTSRNNADNVVKSADYASRDATSRANNTDDNTSLERRNTADVQGRTIASLYGPLSQGQVRPELPANVAGIVGLPSLPATAGAPKPLSETEVKAAVFGQLPAEQQQALVASDAPVENVVTPDGPRIAYRSNAVGQEPLVNKGAEAALKDGVAVVNGKQIPVTRTPNERVWRTADGTAIPTDVQVFDMPKPTGTAAELGMPTTANQTSANNQDANFAAIEDSLNRYETLLKNKPGIVGIPGAVKGAAQDSVAVIRELTQAFGDKAPDAAVSLDEVRSGLERIAPSYDPDIQKARFLASELAYSYAQAQNPQGEVSRQAFERALETVTGGVLRNNDSALAGVSGFRDLLKSKRIGVDRLRNPNAATNAPQPNTGTPQGGAERWERGPDGKLRKVQ